MPVVSRITVSAPLADGTVTVAGGAGAIPGNARAVGRDTVQVVALDYGATTCVPYGADGSFNARLQAGPGTTVLVAATVSNRCEGQPNEAAATAILRVPEGVNYRAASAPFSISGYTGAWHWLASGELGGSASFIQVTSPDAPRELCLVPRLYVYRLFDARGEYVSQVNVNAHGPPLTPTGLPIETDQGDRGYWTLARPTVPGTPLTQQCLSANSRYDLTGWTSGLDAGWYRARIVFYFVTPEGNEVIFQGGDQSSNIASAVETNTGIGYLPLLNVGNAQTPRIPVTLLNESPSWGAGGVRGIVAREDEGRFALGSRRVAPAPFIASPHEPVSGRRVKYILEPYLPTLAYTGFGFVYPQVPLIPLDEAALGTLSVSLRKPDGSTAALATNAPLRQSYLSGSVTNAYPVPLSFAGPGRTYGVTTGLDSLWVDFDQYGLHTVTLSGTLRTLWGQDLTFRGTYDIWVAEPLDLKLGTFEGTPLEVGDEWSPVVAVKPGVAAQVTLNVDHYVNGDAARKQTFQASGRANQFGYFVADRTWRPDAHGEYIARVTASYTDPVDGTLWMGSRAGASIVATPNTPLIAHGQRNDQLAIIAGDQTLRTWFFTRTFDPNCGEAACDAIGRLEARTVGQYPFFKGDVAWQADNSPLFPSITLQDPTGVLSTLAPQVASATSWCNGVFCAQAADSKALSIRTTAGSGAQQRPGSVDSWAYWYTSVIRADALHVQHTVSEVRSAHNQWYGHDSYNCQIGLACFDAWNNDIVGDRSGEEEGDVKLLFGGAVIKSAQGNQFVPYASMTVITPGAVRIPNTNTFSLKDPKGNRICPPYQGATGGLATCGPLLTIQGLPYDLFITPTGTRPGSVLEVGNTFVFSGQAWPTLDVGVTITVTSPSGQVRSFTGRASPSGYIDARGKTFTVSEPGVYTVHVAAVQDRVVPSTGVVPNPAIVADGRTVLRQYGYTAPLSAILGSPDSTYRFFVAAPRTDVATSTQITLSLTTMDGFPYMRVPSAVAVTFDLPANADSLRYTVAIPGLLIRDVAVSGSTARVRIALDWNTLYTDGFTHVVLGADSLEFTLTGRINGQWFAKALNLRGVSPLGGKPAVIQ